MMYYPGAVVLGGYFPLVTTTATITPEIQTGRRRPEDEISLRYLLCDVEMVLPAFLFHAELETLPAQINAAMKWTIPGITLEQMQAETLPKYVELSALWLPPSLSMAGSVRSMRLVAKTHEDED